jgi:hypothetical protein
MTIIISRREHNALIFFTKSTDVTFKATASLPDVLADPILGPSRFPVQTAFVKAYGFSEHVFKWFEGVRV